MKSKRFNFNWKSAKKRDCHIEIEISVGKKDENYEGLELVIEELRKAIHRVNHLSDKKYSYELKTKGYVD